MKQTFAITVLTGVMLSGHANGQATPSSNPGVETQQQAAVANSSITGMVRTVTGQPVPGAVLHLVNLASGQAWMITADEQGKFVASGLAPGRYRLDARQIGLGNGSKEVDLSQTSEVVELRLHREPASKSGTSVLSGSIAPAGVPAATSQNTEQSQSGASEKSQTNAPPIPAIAEVPSTKKSPKPAGKSSTAKVKSGAGFAEAQPDTLSAASAELGNSDNKDTTFNQAQSGDAFLIAGTVGRTVPTAKANEEDDSTGQSSSDQTSKEKTKGAKKRKAKSQFGNVDPVEGVDQAVTDKQLSRLKANRVRVTISEKYGNSLFDAKPYSLTDPNPAKLSYNRERLRTRVGGPLDIPHLYNGRNRTFFYVDYELDRDKVPMDYFDTVPLPAERAGNFSALGIPLYDPLSNLTGARDPLANAIVPASRMDPIALKLMQYFPLPNLAGTVQNYHLQANLPQNADRINAHVLHTISPRLSVQATYNFNSMYGQLPYNLPSLQNSVTAREQNATLGLIQTWSPRFVNETRINFTRSHTLNEGQFTYKEDVAKELGITGSSTDPFFYGVPSVFLANFDPVDDLIPENRTNQTFRASDTFTYSFLRHTIRGGAEIRRMQLDFTLAPAARGEFNFSGLMTSQLDANGNPLNNTGFDLADFLLGLPDQSTIDSDSHMAYMRSWWTIGYIQDDWRISSRLSMNFGARYEVRTPGVEKYNRLADLDLNSSITAAARVLPGQVGPFSGPLPLSLIRTQYTNPAPRIGLAWRPFAKKNMVVRAGYGLFYNAAVYNQLDLSLAGQPPFTHEQARQTSAPNLLSLGNGFPPEDPGIIQNDLAVNPNYKVPYVQIWNFSTELPIRSNLTMELTYTGTKGTDLSLLRSPNRPPPGDPLTIEQRRPIAGLPAFVYEDVGANSIYHALQFRVQRRLSHGLELLGIYTFGKSIDNASYIGGGRKFVVQDDRNFAAERGLSQFDIRHQLSFVSTYDLPFGGQQRWLRDSLFGKILKNWQVSGDASIASGLPYTAVVGGAAASASGTGADYSLRPDLIANPDLPTSQQSLVQFFNTNAFVLPPPVRYGTAGRGIITGPGMFNINSELRRKWRFGPNEDYHLTLAFVAQNLTNRPNLSGIDAFFGTSEFGRVKDVGAMRTIDITLRVSF